MSGDEVFESLDYVLEHVLGTESNLDTLGMTEPELEGLFKLCKFAQDAVKDIPEVGQWTKLKVFFLYNSH